MQERHSDRQRYFEEQAYTTEKYVIPFVHPFLPIGPEHRILEVGCGEGGNLKPFLDLGCDCVGVDLNAQQIERAKDFYDGHPHLSKLELIAGDVYDLNPETLGTFDFIFLRDVIEHIVDQNRFMAYIQSYLKPEGRLFLGFPPWYMPFGGHQQVCSSKVLSKLPYFHLLPVPLYRMVLKAFGESQAVIDELLYIKSTGISIERLRKIILTNGYHIDREQLWLINPNYEVKFGLKKRKQLGLISALPFLRNFLTTCGYYVVRANE